MTLRELAAGAVRRLEAAGIDPDEARRDAALLARHVLAWDSARWLAHRTDPPPPGFGEAFSRAVDRRARREPAAYITGTREFYGRTFVVAPAVLVPRPETELVVEEALAAIAAGTRRASPMIVDVGTGSGCLAITLALEVPDAAVVATDTSAAALVVAHENAVRLDARNVAFRETHLLDGLTAPAALIVSNPPYVPEQDRPALPPEVREFEPNAALFAGDDGLAVIRAIVPAAAERLEPGGWLVCEIGIHQDAAVREIVAGTSGLVWIRTAPDLQGIPRVVVAQRT